MLPRSIANDQYVRQEDGHETSFKVTPSPAFHVQNIVPALIADGFALLPGLTKWFDILSPLKNQQAWQAFADKNVIEIIRTHPKQQRRFFLNDSSQVDQSQQLSVNFEAKNEKSHLTIVEGSEAISDCPLLPDSIRSYLKIGNEFAENVRDVLTDILPAPTLPAFLMVRVFEYHASNPLVGMLPFTHSNKAMRPHVDGSICTLIIAQSDGLLRLGHAGQWYPAVRPDKKPFAVVIPGVAAAHDYGVSPTPHMVLASAEHRISITVAFTPALSENREEAELQIARWRLKHDSDVFQSVS